MEHLPRSHAHVYPSHYPLTPVGLCLISVPVDGLHQIESLGIVYAQRNKGVVKACAPKDLIDYLLFLAPVANTAQGFP